MSPVKGPLAPERLKKMEQLRKSRKKTAAAAMKIKDAKARVLRRKRKNSLSSSKSDDLSFAEAKKQLDSRTLYIKFRKGATLPTSHQELLNLHPDAVDARFTRQSKKKNQIRYCFLNFADQQVCEKAIKELRSKPHLYVDFVGDKSRSKKCKKSHSEKRKPVLMNPTRLVVEARGKSLTEDKLKKLFPECIQVLRPDSEEPRDSGNKNCVVTFFVQFKSAADAKKAFDQSRNSAKKNGITRVQFDKIIPTLAEPEPKVEVKTEDSVPCPDKKDSGTQADSDDEPSMDSDEEGNVDNDSDSEDDDDDDDDDEVPNDEDSDDEEEKDSSD